MGRHKTWTDEDLRSAVATSRSWSGVVRQLGLAKGSSAYESVQRHAIRLNLDLAHLPAPGPGVVPVIPEPIAPPEALTEAVSKSNSWAAVLRELNLDIGSAAYRRVQRATTDLGIDTSHFTGQGWAASPIDAVDMPFTNEVTDQNLHRASTAIATSWFLLRGYLVSVPVEPARYDLVVESDAGLARVQVKSTVTQDRGRWIVGITRHQYDGGVVQNANGARVRSTYRPGEIDLFFIVTGDGGQYLIPLAATNGGKYLTLDVKYAAYKVA